MSTADDVEVGLRNFEEGDKSLWRKLEKTHRGCGGTLWMLAVDCDTGVWVGYKYGVCEKCNGSGSMDALLELEEL